MSSQWAMYCVKHDASPDARSQGHAVSLVHQAAPRGRATGVEDRCDRRHSHACAESHRQHCGIPSRTTTTWRRWGPQALLPGLSKGTAEHCDCVYEAEIIWQGSTSHFTARMIDANPPETLTWEAVTGVGRSRLRFDLEPIDPATTFVTVTLSYEASSRAHTLETLTWGFLSGTLQRTLAELSQLSPGDTSTS